MGRRKRIPRHHYQAYLQSDKWRAKRRAALARGRYRCYVCHATRSAGDRPLQVHHTSYERITEEREDDLAVLCDDCHVAVHALPVRLKEAHVELRRRRLKELARQRPPITYVVTIGEGLEKHITCHSDGSIDTALIEVVVAAGDPTLPRAMPPGQPSPRAARSD